MCATNFSGMPSAEAISALDGVAAKGLEPQEDLDGPASRLLRSWCSFR